MTSPDHTANAPPHDPQADKWADARAAGNKQRAAEERDALMDGLVGVTQALAAALHLRHTCPHCGCLQLPRDKRCPGCDAKAGRLLTTARTQQLGRGAA